MDGTTLAAVLAAIGAAWFGAMYAVEKWAEVRVAQAQAGGRKPPE